MKMSKLNSRLYDPALDQQGKEIKFDIREDEEQDVKLQETIDLLVAAGYFRARIKGLSAFDKIVGGMTWCIDVCNFDIDIDLLFNESSTIGQKISLTERIVKCLPKMKCPHPIEPHQIQGLDFIHIYPVVQWLVKKAIETRSEMGDTNRNFALLQFAKIKCEQTSGVEGAKVEHSSKIVGYLKEKNQPQRKYSRKVARASDRQVQVQSTLLEYGQQNILLSSLMAKNTSNKAQTKNEPATTKPGGAEEEKNLKQLMNDMSETDKKQNKISASAVGQILGIQQTAIQQIVDEFSTKENQLQQEIENLDEASGGLQHKLRLINMLNKQIDHKKTLIDEKHSEVDKIKADENTVNQKLQELKTAERLFQERLAELTDYEANVDKKSVDKLQKLVVINEQMRQKEQDFKKGCKKELAEIELELEKLKKSLEATNTNEDNERFNRVSEQFELAKDKMKGLKLKVARKNREISTLKRKLDEVPSRIELSQYQKRFIELYNQISGVHTQTKQFYIFYNMLEEKRLFMSKEINLLNSIHEQFNRAMSTNNNKDQFIKQLEAIVEGLKLNLSKVSVKKTDLKLKCDGLNDQYNQLIEKKRIYYKTLKDFQEECKRNEMLLASA